jgi:hypothetical protein
MFLIVLSSLLLAITLFGKRLLSDEVTSLSRLKRHRTPTQTRKDWFIHHTIPYPAVRQNFLSSAAS